MPQEFEKKYHFLKNELQNSESIFPNICETVAEFRPHSATIHMHKFLNSELEMAIKEKDFSQLAKLYSVLAHEITHWLDVVGTVWGQEYLTTLFDAYDAALNPDGFSEEKFWKVIKLFDIDRRTMFPQYYRYALHEDVPHDAGRPWSIEYSCGQEFSPDGTIDRKQPIFFTVFGTNPERKRIARQPISVGTLLETNATWQELIIERSFIDQIEDADTRAVEIALWTKEKLKTLYTSELTEYTAPVHLLSARCHTKEAMLSYHAGSLLASICLNLTEQHFQDLKVPNAFAHFGGDRILAFRTAKNRGFAFACIAYDAPRFVPEAGLTLWLESALQMAGLPESENIRTQAYARLEQLHRVLPTRWPMDSTRDYLLDLGRKVFLMRSGLRLDYNLLDILKSDIPLPSIYDKDGNLFGIKPLTLDINRFHPEKMFFSEWELRKFTLNFLTACRGIGQEA